MRVAYPKTAEELILHESRFLLDATSVTKDSVRQVSLAQKLEEYILRIGYSNTHVMGIVIQLMTRGKLMIEFRKYRERLELMDNSDIISRAQAVTLFDDSIANLNKKDPSIRVESDHNLTQRIVIQPRESQ
ncbi:MAG: hypothetical protein AAGA18_12035 [Verrucomicrobiota bacterium]